MTTNSAELKPLPCPFCGYFARVQSRNTKSAASGKHFFVRCPSCHTEGPRSTLSEAEAIERWNSRQAGRTAAQGESKVRYMSAGGVTAEQRSHARRSELHKHGDMILVWVNEGDILFHDRFPDPAPDQAGSAEQVSEELFVELRESLRWALRRIEVSNLGQGDLFKKADDVLARADAEHSDMDEDDAEIGCGECGWKGKTAEVRTVVPLGHPIAHHECPKCGKPCTVSYMTLEPLEDSAEREAFDKWLAETSGFDEHDEAIAWAAWKDRAALSAPERKVMTGEPVLNFEEIEQLFMVVGKTPINFARAVEEAVLKKVAALNQQGEQP